MTSQPTKFFDPKKFEIRLLNGSESDTHAYRSLRTNIRNSKAARNFADSYTREDQLNEQTWREWCAAKREHCIVATFDKQRDNKLISIMMITAQGPANSLVAEWEATWVEPKYRGSGVARRAYDEVHRISEELGYQHAVAFIREDNNHSRKIREAQNFSYMKTKKNEHWADGSIADTNLFILDLGANSASKGEHPYQRAIRRLEETLASMNEEVPFVRDAIKERLELMRPEGEGGTTSTPKIARLG